MPTLGLMDYVFCEGWFRWVIWWATPLYATQISSGQLHISLGNAWPSMQFSRDQIRLPVQCKLFQHHHVYIVKIRASINRFLFNCTDISISCFAFLVCSVWVCYCCKMPIYTVGFKEKSNKII